MLKPFIGSITKSIGQLLSPYEVNSYLSIKTKKRELFQFNDKYEHWQNLFDSDERIIVLGIVICDEQ